MMSMEFSIQATFRFQLAKVNVGLSTHKGNVLHGRNKYLYMCVCVRFPSLNHSIYAKAGQPAIALP